MAVPRRGARRGALVAAGLLWLAPPPGAWAEGPPVSRVPFLDGATRYCYEALVADPGCCRDRQQSFGVESMDISRAGAAWRCVAPAEGGDCLDSRPGPRGEDRLWWPRESDCSTPRVLYVHGGEWRSHGPSQGSYDVLASKLADASGALVFVPDYRLVPVGNASDALRGLLEAWRWLSSHGPGGRDCGGAGTPPLFVGGDSAGGGTGLSLVLMLTGKVDVGPPAAGYFGYSPWLNLACTTPTYYSNAFAAFADDSGDTDYIGDIFHRGMPGRTSAEQRALALAYVAGIEDMLTDAIVSPFFATEALLGPCPPCTWRSAPRRLGPGTAL
ncbi:unnamed protein product [Prorocentrum cordatum]|uniref:Alpha/beta hydrolase fold-3 domain-containing protein n=1 Tax=Prorocentrum cordatum TaxID=2364126 RepID=A0ABN9TMK7_9DINO|nr:unnamed protein product [Polarella glacialis]